jgi:hypothetical protein
MLQQVFNTLTKVFQVFGLHPINCVNNNHQSTKSQLLITLGYASIWIYCGVRHFNLFSVGVFKIKLPLGQRISMLSDVFNNLLGSFVMIALITSILINRKKFSSVLNKIYTTDQQLRRINCRNRTNKPWTIFCVATTLIIFISFGLSILYHLLIAKRFMRDWPRLETCVVWYSAKIYIPMIYMHLIFYVYKVKIYSDNVCEVLK